MFQHISKTVLWEKVSNNYQKFLASINNTIQQSLREASIDSITTLSAQMRRENKESSGTNIESAKHINDSFLKMMEIIKDADEDRRSSLRESLLPLQSTTKYYAQTQRNENRSLDIDKKIELADELIAIR